MLRSPEATVRNPNRLIEFKGVPGREAFCADSWVGNTIIVRFFKAARCRIYIPWQHQKWKSHFLWGRESMVKL